MKHVAKSGKGIQRPDMVLNPCLRVLSVDIDGTIANVTKRKDFALQYGADRSREFFDVFLDGQHYHMDDPVIASREFLNMYREKVGGDIVYLSGRREGTESQTLNWLTVHKFPLGRILHRRKGLNSAKFKSSWLHELKLQGYFIDAHIGDRLEDDGGAAKECEVRFIHVVDHHWPSFDLHN